MTRIDNVPEVLLVHNKQRKENMKIITDGRTLRAMINQGYITEAKYGMYPQVDHNGRNDWNFTYKGENYRLQYIDGSFFPFVFKEGKIK